MEALGIHIGAVVTYQDGFDELANGNYIGRAFDNRIGGFMIAEVARLLKENKKKFPFGLYIVNAVQEEIGLAWCRNDRPEDQTQYCYRYRCNT